MNSVALKSACGLFIALLVALALAGCGGGGGGLLAPSGGTGPAAATALLAGRLLVPTGSLPGDAPSRAAGDLPAGFVPLPGTAVGLGPLTAHTDAGGRYRFDLTSADQAALGAGPLQLSVRLSSTAALAVAVAIVGGRTTLHEIRIDPVRGELVAVLETSLDGAAPGGLDDVARLVDARITGPAAGTGTGTVTGTANVSAPTFRLAGQRLPPAPGDGGPAVELAPAGNSGEVAFRLLRVPPGAALLQAEQAGYATCAVSLTVPAGLTLSNLRLDLAPLAAAPTLRLVAVSGDLASGPAGGLLPSPLVVRVTDPAGLPVAGISVRFVVEAGGGVVDASPVASGNQSLAVTAADGIATCARWTLGGAPGPQSVRASLPVDPRVTHLFTATALAVTPAANLLTLPAAATARKSRAFAYALGEAAGSARIVWTGISGPDAGEVRTRDLAGAELAAGPHAVDPAFGEEPALVSGTVYDVRLEGVAPSGAAALPVTNAGVLYTTDLPAAPDPAKFGLSNRLGRVAVLADGAVPEACKLRLYLDGVLAAESGWTGRGGLNAGDTPFTGLAERPAGTQVAYAIVNAIPGYAEGVESDRSADGTVPAPPVPDRIYYTALAVRFVVAPSLNGSDPTGGRLRLIADGPGAGQYVQSVPFALDADAALAPADFVPPATGFAPGTAFAYTFTSDSGNESAPTADGTLPAPPVDAYLASRAGGADNTENYVNLRSQAAPVVRVTPVAGQSAADELFATLTDGTSTVTNLGAAGIPNPTNGAPVDATLADASALADGPLALSAYARGADSGNVSAPRAGRAGRKDTLRPAVATLEFQDSATATADPDGFVDRIRLVFSEPVATVSGLAPRAADFGALTLPDGAAATIPDPPVPGWNGLLTEIAFENLSDQATPRTDAGATGLAAVPPGVWRDLAGNANDATFADGLALVDRAAPILLAIASDRPLDSGQVLGPPDADPGTTFTFTFSEPVRQGLGFDPNDLKSIFTDATGGAWIDGNPDTFDTALVDLRFSGGTAQLIFLQSTNFDPAIGGTWSVGDEMNLKRPILPESIEDAAGNTAVRALNNVVIRWP